MQYWDVFILKKNCMFIQKRNLTGHPHPVFYLTICDFSLYLTLLKVQNMLKIGWAFRTTDGYQGREAAMERIE